MVESLWKSAEELNLVAVDGELTTIGASCNIGLDDTGRALDTVYFKV